MLFYRPTRSASLLIQEPPVEDVVATLQGSRKGWGFFVPPEPEDELTPGMAAQDGSPTTESVQSEAERSQSDDRRLPAQDELVTQKLDPKSLENSLRLLDRRTTQEFMDKGIWVLYLAAGFLEWVDPGDDREVRTPIVLVPVDLGRSSPKEPFRLRLSEEEVVVNPALSVKMEVEFGLLLPPIDESDELNIVDYLRQVATAVQDRGWSVSYEAAIDIFSFYKEVMYKDLKDNEDAICANEIVRALALGDESDVDLYFPPTREEDLDEMFPVEEMATIRDADASQRRSIVAAQQGHSFVMDGPPGTGKSQTISNIIAQALHDDRTVLFVSEKIAALEVVKARLDEAGLGEYLLELHSHKATRKEVAHSLYHALRTFPRPPEIANRATIDKLAARRRELTAYATAMNESRHPLGKSLHSAIGRIAQLSDLNQAPLAQLESINLDTGTYNSILEATADLSRAWGPALRGDDFLWRGVDERFSSVGGKRDAAVRLETAQANLESLRDRVGDIAELLELWWNESPDQADDLVSVLKILENSRPIPLAWLTSESLAPVVARSSQLKDLTKEHQQAVLSLKTLVGPNWRDLSPEDAEAVREARDWLKDIQLRWPVSDTTTGEDARSLREFNTANATATMRLNELTETLAVAFGFEPEGSAIGKSKDLLLLAELTVSTSKPESNWLDGVSLPRVTEAAEVLGSAVAEYRQNADRLDDLFQSSVLDLDLESLQVRFQTSHRGLNKLGGAYRADKKILAEHTKQGKTTKIVISALSQAIEWKKTAERLEQAEDSYADLLGDHYYLGVDSSFDSIADAIHVAEKATQLAADLLVDREQFKKQLARDMRADPSVSGVAADLGPAVDSWAAKNQKVFGVAYSEISSLPYIELGRRFHNSMGPINAIAQIQTAVERNAGTSLTMSQVSETLNDRNVVHGVESDVSSSFEADRTLIGVRYSGVDSDWDKITADIEWAEALRSAVHAPIEDDTAQRLLESNEEPGLLDVRHKAWVGARDAVTSLFVGERGDEISGDLDASFIGASDLLETLSETLSDVDEWSAFVGARNALAGHGLAAAVESAIDNAIPAVNLVPTIERATLEAWVDEILDEDERLAHTRSQDRDAFVEEFRNLDQEVLDAGAAKVMRAVNDRLPRSRLGPAGIIEREGQKKRRHMPVRDLIEKTKDVVQAFKPCFMMSPLSVSQFLTPDVTFDIVIFDEASQVRPSDAVNCVYRGQQLVIAGDQKQLPPTNFFQRVSMDGGDEYEEDQIDEFESVLDLAKAGGMESLPLRWHYRSQHESLITYSNYSFYDGNLITFPGALDHAPDVGIELFHVEDGEYRRGGARDNPVEAKVVVDRVLFHARQHPDLTLGVVAFSEAQASTIEYFVDQERRNHPDLEQFFEGDRLSGFFVKNLESVQGDERDIIIFSIGYGPDEMGKITMNFGPLNRPGGERRLNVAITRARRRVEIVSSIRSDDFRSTGSAGPRHLQRYLEFAERGISALALDIGDSDLDTESPFEEEVLRVIRSLGFDVKPQVGVAGYRVDLGVSDPAAPGRYLIGVECDGAMYHSSRVARDRDRLRQEVLERLGWNLHRIWGTSWYQNRELEEKRLAEAIEAARTNRQRPETIPKPSPKIEPELLDIDFDGDPEWVVAYEVSNPSIPRYYKMSDAAALPEMAVAIAAVVNVEGPVAKEVVLRRLREAWGVGRAGRKIRENFDMSLLRVSASVREDRRHFLWRKPDHELRVRMPTEDPATRRSIDEISMEELRLAVVNLVGDSKRATSDELTAASARLFGWQRRGPDIAEGLDKAVRSLLKSKKLRRDGQYLAVNAEPEP